MARVNLIKATLHIHNKAIRHHKVARLTHHRTSRHMASRFHPMHRSILTSHRFHLAKVHQAPMLSLVVMVPLATVV